MAWADRDAYLADPAFVRQPVEQLLSDGLRDARGAARST